MRSKWLKCLVLYWHIDSDEKVLTVASEETVWEGEVLKGFIIIKILMFLNVGSMSLVLVLWDLTQDLNQVNCYRMAEHWTRDRKSECATDTSVTLSRLLLLSGPQLPCSKIKAGLDNHSGYSQTCHFDLPTSQGVQGMCLWVSSMEFFNILLEPVHTSHRICDT